MDFECQIHQLNQKHSEETALRVNQVASEILEHEEEITQLGKSIEATLPQINAFNEELAQLESNLSVETEQEQLIITSNKDLSSCLALLFAQLEPFKKELKKHQAKLDNANSRVRSVCLRRFSTDITKLAEAETDATISAEQEEIRKVTELQSKLKSGTLTCRPRGLRSARSIVTFICKEKLTQAELDKQCCLSLLESAKYSKEHLLERQKVVRDYEASKLKDDSEKTYIKSSCQPEDQQPPPNMTLLV
ncbi:hypothetical protein Tco_0616011 [Tanacetum coccineum]